jgi:type IV fimbrial biogenesis protein FimT
MLVMKLKSSGFSLIELMVVVALLAIVASVGFPSFRGMLMNSQVRNATESVLNGIQKARAEAVKRNANVEFVLGADTGWVVQLPSGTNIESRSSSEGSVNVTRTTTPATSTTVTFNSFGGVTAANATAPTAPFTQVDFAATGADRSLRVTVGAGGNVRMCDPNLAAGSNPRAC